ncbi:MAG TPA: hypothetical protein VGD17_08930 [Chitinophagaceae bacterium]
MRFFLIIPAMLLFLSNIPFIHKMDMKEMMASMKKEGCCKSEQSSKPAESGSCHNDESAKSCKMESESQISPVSSEDQEDPGDGEQKECGMQTATSCVCICCFTFAAPDQPDAKLLFGCSDTQQMLADYFQKNWKDPHLAIPWQPPDVLI